MAELRTCCPRCGAEAVHGVAPGAGCPGCLLQLGWLEDDTPDEIGPYRILQTLGEGGMGIVYLAEQQRPIRRRVALKLIKLGMDTKQVVSRFESERQALALMDHPNVAKVFDAGATESGRPYFVMEYVQGMTLTDHCDHYGLGLESKLELFQQACEAIQHAHRRGLIHRDIKPGNILVAREEDRDRVQVIDFGIAKAIAEPLTQHSLLTLHGAVVGTPAYMSPEQTGLDGDAVETRSDVFSLGAVLYELLTGAPPLDTENLRDSHPGELARRIREDIPPRPRLRNPERAIPDDLDWIVMKALEKDPDRRYDSPAELADDIRRHLDDEPVSARSPSLIYRAVKLLRRHVSRPGERRRALMVVASVAVLAGAAGTAAVSEWRAARQASLAQWLGEEIRDVEWQARVAQMAPLHALETDFEPLRARLDELRRILDEGSSRVRGPASYALGRGYLALRDLRAALEHLQLAWEQGYRSAEVATTLGLALGEVYRGERARAHMHGSPTAVEERLREIEGLYRDRALALLGNESQVSSSRLDPESGSLPPEYLAALLASYQERYEDAIQSARNAAASSPWLFEAAVLEGDVLQERANQLWNAGDGPAALAAATEAEADYERAAAIADSCFEARLGLCGLAGLRLHMGLHGVELDLESAFADAERACGDALTIDDENAEVHRHFSSALSLWGVAVRRQGGNPDPVYDRATEHAEAAIRLSESRREHVLELAEIHRVRAYWDRLRGLDPRPWLDRAEQGYRRFLEIDPGFHEFNQLGLIYWVRAEYEIEQGLDARRSLDAAVDAFRGALEINPRQARAYGSLVEQAAIRAAEQKRLGEDPCSELVELAQFLQSLPRQPDLAAQSEAEKRLSLLRERTCGL